MKGQLARNNAVRASFEGGQMPIHRRVPKRGFVNIHRIEVVGVNVGQLEGTYGKGEDVTVETLRNRGLLPKRAEIVKLLGDGELNTALDIRVHRASASARAKVEAAGGSVTLLELPPADAERMARRAAKRERRGAQAAAKRAQIQKGSS
jgi:large subunit ribosomal protein L15